MPRVFISDKLDAGGLKLLEHRPGALIVAADQRRGQPLLHRQGDELLLSAIVDVALDPPPLVVLRPDQTLS